MKAWRNGKNSWQPGVGEICFVSQHVQGFQAVVRETHHSWVVKDDEKEARGPVLQSELSDVSSLQVHIQLCHEKIQYTKYTPNEVKDAVSLAVHTVLTTVYKLWIARGCYCTAVYFTINPSVIHFEKKAGTLLYEVC